MILFPPPINLFLAALTLSEQTIKRLTIISLIPSLSILFYKERDMDGWNRSLRDDQYPYRRHRENPSFSSTLLDAIYRSIDETAGCRGGDGGGEELVLCRDTMKKKQSNSAVKGCGVGGFEDDEDMANIRRACLIEKWMEKKVTEKVVVRRMSVADSERKSRSESQSVFLKSSSSSSDSSSGGGFSSSETESINGLSARSSTLTGHRPKPIRTSVSAQPEKFTKHGSQFKVFDKCHQKPKHENGFVKTKSKAMKLYGDLKKAKQPISPGGKLANFLNSLFTAGTSKKAKISSATSGYNDTITETKSKSSSTTCSSASSFSRSCLSKTPSSRGKSSTGTKRSVRFVDEDNQPCPRKSLYQGEPTLRNSINEELKFLIMEKNQRVEEAARDLLKSYQKKVEYEFLEMRNVQEEEFENDGDGEEDDDAASYESSDLFELDNLSAIGIERYREELPVYETTRLDTNRAIAKGLIS